jgi:FkbM family methyltransferase
MSIRKILLSALGERNYLSLLSNTFQLLYPTGLLGKEYQDVYFLKKFVRQGDWCVDIGAHLGYFSLELSRLVRPDGKVLAIEPMSKFNRVLGRLLTSHKAENVTLYPVALGGDGEYVEMGIPEVGRNKKFAYARVMESSPGLQYVESEKVPNRQGDDLFKDLHRLDFVKCDVEGLEFKVISSMIGTVKKYRPILLCEFFDRAERIRLFELLRGMDYQLFRLEANKWHAVDVYGEGSVISQNNYFIPPARREQLKHLFAPGPATTSS